MNLSLFLLSFLSLFYFNQEETYPKEFRIGTHSYVMSLKKQHNHDGDVNATYFIVHKKGDVKNQVSSHKLAEQNGQNTIIGTYRITKQFIEFKEVYTTRSIDSMTKRFYPNKDGHLILTGYTDFKDGIANRTRL